MVMYEYHRGVSKTVDSEAVAGPGQSLLRMRGLSGEDNNPDPYFSSSSAVKVILTLSICKRCLSLGIKLESQLCSFIGLVLNTKTSPRTGSG